MQKAPVLSASLRVGDKAVAYTLADAAYGSNPSRGWGETRRPMDATARSPDAALWWRSHSIDTVGAKGKDDNCECWPHTRRADCHRLLCAVHAPRGTAWPDSARSHLAGGRSLAQRSGPLSRAERLLPTRTPEQEPARGSPCAQVGAREQTRWCVSRLAQAHDPTPIGGSRATERRFATPLDHLPYG